MWYILTLCRSPREWCKLYAEYNNGCYNNQWMVLDYRFFTPGKGLSEGGFYILEQIPGYVEYYDMTTCLSKEWLTCRELNERGYYGSYNIAYNEKVYELSGAIDLFEKYISNFVKVMSITAGRWLLLCQVSTCSNLCARCSSSAWWIQFPSHASIQRLQARSTQSVQWISWIHWIVCDRL